MHWHPPRILSDKTPCLLEPSCPRQITKKFRHRLHAGHQQMVPRAGQVEVRSAEAGIGRAFFLSSEGRSHHGFISQEEVIAGLVTRERPELVVRPIHGDFLRPFALPVGHAPLLGLFPGSTIGNRPRRRPSWRGCGASWTAARWWSASI